MPETARNRPPPPPREVSNRRAARRHPIQLRVDVLPLLDPAGQLVMGRPRQGISIDLNESGMLCCRVGYLPLGGVVRLFLRLPDLPEQPLTCQARVVRCDLSTTPCYGFKFIDLPPSDVPRLRRYTEGLRRAGHALSWMYRFDS